MVENVAKEKAFYFAYGLDLTKSLQVNIYECLQQNSAGIPQTTVV